VTRLLINLFFIVIICITLAAMPVNTQLLDMFDFGDLFSKEAPDKELEEVPEPEEFHPSYSYEFIDYEGQRLINPQTLTIKVTSNITEDHLDEHGPLELELLLTSGSDFSKTLPMTAFVKDTNQGYDDNNVNYTYTLDISQATLGLDQEGHYLGQVQVKASGQAVLDLKMTYLSDITYVKPSNTSDNYGYVTYFYSKDKTHVIPVGLDMPQPESEILAVRSSLYQVPSPTSDLAQEGIIPNFSSIDTLGKDHYGLYLTSSQLENYVSNQAEADLMVEAISKTLLNLDNFKKLSLYVDGSQAAGKLYDVDLSQTLEQNKINKVYLPVLSGQTTYLSPYDLGSQDQNSLVYEIIDTYKAGQFQQDSFVPLLAPEVILNTAVIEGTTISLDFNKAFLDNLDGLTQYQALLINALVYSVTSLDKIETLQFTVEGQVLTTYGGMDLSQPLAAPAYINYIGQF